jgi:MFS family permease
VRRLLALVCVVVFVDTMLFGALVPLLPGYADDFDLSKLQAGALFAAFGAGALFGGIPGGVLAARVGPRRAVVAGLAVLALASIGFALAGSPLSLGVARFVQGLSSTMTWAGALAWVTVEADRSRRGQTLGTVFGFAVAGAIAGPMFGALAEAASIRVTFAVVGAGALILAMVAALHPPAREQASTGGGLAAAFADPAFLVGLWLSALPAFFFGVLDVLAPLALHDAGWSALTIGSVFVVAGLAEVAVSPVVGRASDRHGRLLPIRVGLVAAASTSVLLAVVSRPVLLVVVAVASAVSFGSLFTPGMALTSDRAELAGLALGLGYGLMNTAWAVGVVLGPTLGGGLADTFGDPVPYLLCAVLAAATFAAVEQRRRRGQAARALSSEAGNSSSAQAASSGRRR